MSIPERFFGRGPELEKLGHAAADTGLVVVWGPPGSGKSAIARRHAEGELRRGAEVVCVDVSGVRTERALVEALAAELSVTLDGGDDAATAIAHAAAVRGALVVVDDADRLEPPARAALASIATRARVIVTTQLPDPFAGASERRVEIAPLAPGEAIALYTHLSDRDPDEAATEIVRRLDGLPLAIALAAARAQLLGNAELLARLDAKLDLLAHAEGDDAPAHHRTLRAAIAWSLSLLSSVDRDALAACAVFEAPFDAGLAEAVVAAPSSAPAALDALGRLRARALLRVGPVDDAGRPQLSLLEAVRDFVRDETSVEARDRLVVRHAEAVVRRTSADAEAVRRGRAVPRSLVARRRDLLLAATDLAVPAALAAEATLALAALRVVTGPFETVVEQSARALGRLSEEDDRRLGVRLAIARGQACRAMGRHGEAEEAAKSALRAAASIGDARLEADALRLAGAVARSRGDAALAIQRLEEALARYRAIGDRALLGIGLGELGAANQSAGELERAIALNQEAVAMDVLEESRRAEGIARSYVAVATHRLGRPAEAVALHEEALRIHRAAGDRRMEGAELLHLGFVHHELAAPAAAREAFREAKRVLGAAGARGLEAMAHVLSARLAVDEGAAEEARLELAEARAAAPWKRTGWSRLEATRAMVEGHLAMSLDAPTQAATAYGEALAASRDVEVGFEALTPAYLALALARANGSAGAIDAALEQARTLVARVKSPHVAVAFAILEAGARRSAPPSVGKDGQASSSEIRRALAFAGTRRAIVIRDDARRVVLADGRDLDLGRRKNVRLVLMTLAEARRDRPGTPVDAATLIGAGWPGERMGAAAATKRLHTAIWTLRSLGLGTLLASSEEGYWLDPTVGIDLG